MVQTFRWLVPLALTVAAPAALAETIHARLDGTQEVPSTMSEGEGEFRAFVNDREGTIDYELTYGGLDGDATASHIHVGQPGANGGVSAFLCGGGGKPACPPAGGTVSGRITAADVVGPVAQRVPAGDFERLVRAIRERVTYVNVHTTLVPGGEIRGAIK